MRDIRRVLIVMRYHLKELLGDNVDRKMMYTGTRLKRKFNLKTRNND